ncbi:hypothetical protein AM352_00325 [Citrobacter koseri]|nr:hypothetical protein AM352_00325 [Citrobacter koseri]PWY10926.1 hypothetical protein DL345_15465 [Citrobacter koseri]
MIYLLFNAVVFMVSFQRVFKATFGNTVAPARCLLKYILLCKRSQVSGKIASFRPKDDTVTYP